MGKVAYRHPNCLDMDMIVERVFYTLETGERKYKVLFVAQRNPELVFCIDRVFLTEQQLKAWKKIS